MGKSIDEMIEAGQRARRKAEEPIPIPADSPIQDDGELRTPEETQRLAQLHMEIEHTQQVREAQQRFESKDRTNQILTHRCIDPHESPRIQTWIHKWVNITPSICTEEHCGFDASVAHGFVNGWNSVPEKMQFDAKRSMREFVLETLGRHKAIKHATVGPKHIRTAEEAVKAKAARQHQIPGGFIVNPNI